MKILWKSKDKEYFLRTLRQRASGVSQEIELKVRAILEDVRRNGDRAVFKYTRLFDYLKADRFAISSEEISSHAARVDSAVMKALRFSAKRIKMFHEKQKERTWYVTEPGYHKVYVNRNSDITKILQVKQNASDVILGQIINPIERVGIYIPGGKASYPSTVLMNVIPAQVAGVKEIAICVPTPKGEINPNVMAAIKLLNIREVYRVGGAQAIGAMAYGTKTIKKVDKIVGPGNIYVSTAKKLVFGEVDIDMIAGPSEILIIADDSANPLYVAADLLSQAEHDEYASSILVTDSNKLADDVRTEIMKQLDKLKRKEIAQKSLENYGAIILIKDIKEAAEVTNLISPEHLEIMTIKPEKILPMINNAGAIFIGSWSPEALGDYSAGPNHTLPTGGTARFSSPLGVYDFIKRSSLLSFTGKGFRKLAKAVKIIAEAEGLEAHGNTIKVRET